MFKKLLFLILINQAALILSMEEDDPRGTKRPREDEQYLKNDREIKRSRLEIQEDDSQQELLTEETNLLQGLPAELQLLIYSFVLKNNKSVGESIKYFFTCPQLNKQNLNFFQSKQNYNYLLKCIFSEGDNILNILSEPKNKIIKNKLNEFIYEELFLNKEYMLKLLLNLIETNFEKCLKLISVFSDSYLDKLLLSNNGSEDANKVLTWMDEISPALVNEFSKFCENLANDQNIMSNENQTVVYLYNGFNYMKKIIEFASAPNFECDFDNDMLNYFAGNGFVGVFKFLISKNIDIAEFLHCRDWHRPVIYNNQLKILELFIELGTDINTTDARGQVGYFLKNIIYQNNFDMAKFLIEKGAIVLPYMLVTMCDLDTQILELCLNKLISQGIDLERNDLNKLALLYTRYSNLTNIKKLIETLIRQFQPNWNPDSPYRF